MSFEDFSEDVILRPSIFSYLVLFGSERLPLQYSHSGDCKQSDGFWFSGLTLRLGFKNRFSFRLST